MTDDEIAHLHNMALGEALFASTLANIVFTRLAMIAPTGQEADLIDHALLVLERNQTLVGGGPGAVEYARARLEGLRKTWSARQP